MSDAGVVLRHEGGTVVVDLGGEEARCVVRKSLRRDDAKGVAVGDRVRVSRSGDGLAVEAVEPRKGWISRPDPSNPRREQVIVANVDFALVVVAAKQPDLSPGLIDRFLVAIEGRGIDAGLAVNKIDLDPDGTRGSAVSGYRAIGYPVVEVSSATGAGLEELRELLRGRTTTMLGHSGVGKSSLANALDPSLRIRVGEVNDFTGLGTHTTTAVSLLRLPWGGYLVDTPGIREFGLWRIPSRELHRCFREMAPLAPECRFNDCIHEREPGCAVKAAAESGRIFSWRWESYLRLLAEMREAEAGEFR